MASRFSALSPSGEPRGGLVIDGDLVGRSPLTPAEVLIRWGLPILLVFSALALWAERRVESNVADHAVSELATNEFDAGSLEILVEHRDVTVLGALPSGVTRNDVQVALLGTGDIPIKEVNVEAAPPVPESLGEISVIVRAENQQIVITGNLPSRDHRDSLIESASLSGSSVVDQLTVSGLEPAAPDANAQIARLGRLLPLLGEGVKTAELVLGPDGNVIGVVDTVDSTFAAPLIAAGGSGVRIRAPEPVGQLDVQVTWDGETVILTGAVLTQQHRAALHSSAASAVGGEKVVNNLEVLDRAPAIIGPGAKIIAFADALSLLSVMNSADAWLTDTDLTVNGEVVGEDAADRLDIVVQRSAYSGLRPGGSINIVAPEPTLQDQIDELQLALDGLQEALRETVVFGSASADLSEDAQASLSAVVAAMERHPDPVVEVGGHTDDDASEDFNLALSQERADAVRAFISESGIDPSRLVAVGYGESLPIADNTTAEGREQNRRVEFTAQESF